MYIIEKSEEQLETGPEPDLKRGSQSETSSLPRVTR